jgi:molybdopterin-guanine dinucleotide biosynthesis protein B
LLPALAAHGLRVSTIKRTHHDVDMDQPGKDSFRHRQAGAQEVMVVSGTRWALLRETPQGADLHHLAARLAPCDLILAEGFKLEDFPKIEVHRPALGKPRLWPDTPGIVALATDGPAGEGLPCLDLNDAPAIAARIVREGWGEG